MNHNLTSLIFSLYISSNYFKIVLEMLSKAVFIPSWIFVNLMSQRQEIKYFNIYPVLKKKYASQIKLKQYSTVCFNRKMSTF